MFRDLEEALEMGMDWSLREGMLKYYVDVCYYEIVTKRLNSLTHCCA